MIIKFDGYKSIYKGTEVDEAVGRAQKAITLDRDNVFTGTNTFEAPVYLGDGAEATTPDSSDNSSRVATTAFVKEQGFISDLTSEMITTALGFTPYSSSNPEGYEANVINTIKVNNVAQTVTSKTVNITVPTKVSDLTNDSGFITGITSTDVTTALGYTPENAGNKVTSLSASSTDTEYPSAKIVYTLTNANSTAISTINGKIPSEATSSNQLADKAFVNSSIATSTADFVGTFDSLAELEAYTGPVTNNDYAFVVGTDSAGNTVYNRYKYTTATTPASWQFEYALNNSSFTATQWAAINSGITSSGVTLLGTALQPNDNISQLTNDAGYITGITSTDVTTALGYTPYNATNPDGYITGITSSDVTTALGYTPYNATNPDKFISNTATGTNSLTILGTATTYPSAINIGVGTQAEGSGTAVGWSAKAQGEQSVALGYGAKSTVRAIQLGYGTNSTPATLSVGFNNTNYQLLDGTTGLIPDARISTNIARTSDIPTDTSDLTNGAGYITGITSSDVTAALGYTPYDATNPDGFITGITSSDVTTALGYTPYNGATNPNGYISSASISSLTDTSVSNVSNGQALLYNSTSGKWENEDIITSVAWGGITGTLSDQTDLQNALDAKTTMAAVEAKGYITGITSSDVTTALGYTPYDGATNPNGYIVGISSSDVTTALGYTPEDASNKVTSLSASSTDTQYPSAKCVYDSIQASTITTLSGLTDVSISSASNNQGLLYDSTSGKWKNKNVLTSISWGEIGGTLSNQTDLQNALDAKTTMAAVEAKGYITGITGSDVVSALGYTPYDASNPNGYIIGISSSDVTTALGYTPYNSSNPDGYISGITSSMVTTALGYTPYDSSNPDSYISGISSSDVITALGYTPYDSSNPDNYISGISSSDVTTALGYTPYNGATNPNGYISGITSNMVTTALGYTPYNGATNPNGYISGITSSMVTTALGFTPYNSSNPDGYITGISSSDVTTALGYTPASESALTTGLASKQDTLVSGTNIKTINSTSLLGSGDIAVQPVISSSNKLSSDLVDDTNNTHKFATSAQLAQIGTNQTDIATINGKIPSQASTSNQLADKAFVNSSVQTATANFRGNWDNWTDVPSSVSEYPEDYAGSTTPTVNDYLVVQDASDYTGDTLEGTWRFKYTGTWATDGKSGWIPEYQVNETPLTSAQLAALNSGITIEGVNLINSALQPDDLIAGNGITLSSSDNRDTAVITTVGSARWQGVTYGDDKFVAVGNDGYIAYSSDGDTWSTPTQVGTNAWYGVTYGGGKFVAVGNLDYITTSTDGINWTTPIQPATITSGRLNDIQYGNGIFLAVGYRYYVSTDGVNWTSVTNSSTLSYGRRVIYDGTKFVVIEDNHGAIATTTDGTTWTSRVEFVDNYVNPSIAYGNGIYTVCSRSSSNDFYYSTDCENWNVSTRPQDISIGGSSLLFADNKFIMGGVASSKFSTAVSLDGINWGSQVDMSTSATYGFLSITYGNDKFVAVGDSGCIMSFTTGFKPIVISSEITSSDVTEALGYIPYNSSNPNGYTSNVGTVTSVNNTQPDANGNVSLSISTSLSGLTDVSLSSPTQGQNLTYDATTGKWKNTSTSATIAWGGITGTLSDQTDLQSALDAKTTMAAVEAKGYITGITSSDVTTALGYTPANSSDLASYVTTSTDQDITGTKTFVGSKKIAFKQSGTNDKLGFTLYNNSGLEKGYLEFNPTNTIDGAPLMTLGNYASSSSSITHVGFRKFSNVSGATGAYNLLTPLVADARTPFNLTTTYKNFYLPLGITDGTTTLTTAKTGLLDISSFLSGFLTGITSSDVTTALGYTPYDGATNPNGYITGITSSDVTTALGYTPVNPSSLATVATTGDYDDLIDKPTIPTATSDLTNDSGYITGISSSDVTTALGYTPYSSSNPDGYISGITSSMVTTALGYTPYSSSNPDGYISGISSSDITTALGYTPYNGATNPNGYITGITSNMVTTALGFTPYDNSNPDGYITGITSSDVTTALGYTPVNPSSLATVATTGDYDDLINKPSTPNPNPAYGTSSTAAATAQKIVSIPEITSLEVGQVLYIKPSATSTVANSTIKLNDFDPYPMRYNNAAITTSTDSIVWGANFVSIFVFDGSYWQFAGHGLDSNTTYSGMTISEGTTGTATTTRLLTAANLKGIIQGTKLTGLDTTDDSEVVATDTVLSGIGKLQAQINASKILINITYDDLVTLKTNEELYEGAFYRIVDFVTTSNGASPNNNEPSRSAEHQFDIIIQALGNSNLADKGTCALHSGDTYFANNNLGAWQIWYDIENDTTKYAWADTTNGKGVIYRLIDEFGNDLPYDFKNIQFYRDSANYTSIASYLTASDNYYYTFSKNTSGTITDKSLDALTHDNIIGQYIDANNIMLLLNTVFVHTSTTVTDTNNIGSSSYNNTFAGSCYGNTIGMMCHDNIVDNNFIYNNISHVFRSNTVGADCKSNKIGNYCYENTISINFYYNQLGDYFYGNTISKTFGYNTIGHSFYNNNCQNTAGTNYGVYRCTIGNVVYNNTISDSFLRCTLGNNILSMTIGSNVICSDIGSFVAYSTIGNGCNSLILEPNSRYFDIPANTNYLTLGSNCSGTNGARLSLSGLPTSNTYSVYVNRDISGGVIAKWNDGITTYGKYKATTSTATWTDVNSKQIQSDWNQSDSTAVDYIKNKPNIPSGVIVDQTYDGTSTNAQSGVAIEGAGFVKNTATGVGDLTINGTATQSNRSINIGTSSSATAGYCVALGYEAEASGTGATAIGDTAKATASRTIQIGHGTNSTASSLQVGFGTSATNYTLLDGTTGLIPDARVSSNIARTSQIPDTSNLADKDLSNLSSTGEAKFQAPLVSGTNIKTVNNTSILGSGNIDTSDVFVAEFWVTSYSDITTEIVAGKTIFCSVGSHGASAEQGNLAPLMRGSAGVLYFSCVRDNIVYTYECRSTGWTATKNTLQKANLVTSISSSSTDAQYPSAKCVYDTVSGIQTLQPITTTSASITLTDVDSLYKLTPSSATTVSFTNSTSASATKAYTFELCIDMSSTAYAITFPNSVAWQEGEIPDLSSTGIYFFAFRTIDGGTTWLGNLQGRW